jgi:hypothetical protein
VYGDTLLNGSGRRRSEWQFGIGVQHEILPRLSAEVTFNRRNYSNLTVTDQLGVGCDRYNGTVDLQTCLNNYLNYTSTQYDFFTVVAPRDPGLPNGGGYTVRGLANPKAAFPPGRPSAVTINDELEYEWNGVDTNFVWRAPNGLRINGGTSTGRAVRDLCSGSTPMPGQASELDAPNVKARAGNPPGCRPNTRFETNVRGSAAYTIPRVDVLVSTVFQYRPGVQIDAFLTATRDQVVWDPASANRATQPCTGQQAGQVGCFVPTSNTITATNYRLNLLDPGDLYGEGYTIFDLKLGKNIRFANKRLNVGVDVYNLFNNDAIRTYEDDYPFDPAAGNRPWGAPVTLLSPRFARLQVQFDF